MHQKYISQSVKCSKWQTTQRSFCIADPFNFKPYKRLLFEENNSFFKNAQGIYFKAKKLNNTKMLEATSRVGWVDTAGSDWRPSCWVPGLKGIFIAGCRACKTVPYKTCIQSLAAMLCNGPYKQLFAAQWWSFIHPLNPDCPYVILHMSIYLAVCDILFFFFSISIRPSIEPCVCLVVYLAVSLSVI